MDGLELSPLCGGRRWGGRASSVCARAWMHYAWACTERWGERGLKESFSSINSPKCACKHSLLFFMCYVLCRQEGGAGGQGWGWFDVVVTAPDLSAITVAAGEGGHFRAWTAKSCF